MKNKIDTQYVKNYLSKYSKTELLDEYINYKKKMKFKCECGNIFYRNFSNLLRNNYCKCKDCTTKIRVDNRKLKIEEVDKIIKEHGLIRMGEFINTRNKILCMNKDGFLGKINITNLKKNKMFTVLSPKFDPESTIYNSNKIINNKGCKTKVLKFLNNESLQNSKVLCKCECGNIYDVKLSSLIYNNAYRCRSCSKNESSLEKKVDSFLVSNNILFEKQKRFNDCKDKNTLPFDFYIPSMNICIEVDGKQHYTVINFSNNFEISKLQFEKIKKHDIIKNEYCKQKNIKLVRISYLEIQNDEYIKILNNLFNLS
jgi:very-short-patch-repair endonuclease